MGYETLLARPQLIVPPVLLDLYLWFGIHVTSDPLTLKLGNWLREQSSDGDRVARLVEDNVFRNVHELAAVWLPTVRVPSFVASLSSETAYRLESWKPAVTLPWWGVLLAALLFLVAGLLVAAEYLVAIAAVSTGREVSLFRRPVTATAGDALRLAGWVAALGAIGLLVTWPLLVGIVVATEIGAGVSFWLMLLLLVPVSWGFVFFFFSVQAMFIDGTGPFGAIRSSYLVVRSDFWRSLGVISAYYLVMLGFPQVWRLLISEPIGLAIAILGHAIIGTGMIAATMVFYRDRARQLRIAGPI